MDIRKIRKSLKLNQDEFGIKLGVSRGTIINWEKGEKIPEPKMSFIRQMLQKEYPQLIGEVEGLEEPTEVYASATQERIENLEREVRMKDEMIAILREHIELLKKNAAENLRPKE